MSDHRDEPGAFAEADRRAYLARMAELIDQHGHALQGVFGDTSDETFMYTVGLAAHDHPEFIVFGLPAEIGGALLNDLGGRVHDGARFHHGQVLDDVVHDYPVALLEVLDSRSHLTVANAMFRTSDVPIRALQMVFPDAQSRWPWQEGSTVSEMLLLGPVPDELA